MSIKRDTSAQKRRITANAVVIISALITFFTACSGGGSKQPPKKEAIPVTVGSVIKKTLPVEIFATGNIEADNTVMVKAQIGGELSKVYFKEGQDVNKGDLIFLIDPRSYEELIKQTEANLAKDTAQMENAQTEVRRYAELWGKGFVSKEQYDLVRTNANALEASVRANKALLENARLQLSYCYIHSPITGRTGSLLVDQGNLIKANADNPMVIINQIQPINVTFSVPEQYLPKIKKYIATKKLKVEAFTPQEEKSPVEGVLTFIDNTVDISTGTIKLKGTFANKEKRLWPGQFVNVVLTLSIQPDAVVVPSRAIQTGQAGEYVFVVKNDLTVESRPVTVDRTMNGEAVIEKGLAPGEKIVTDGQLRLIPGVKVVIKNNNGKTQGK